MTDQNRKTLRSFYCRDYLWELFEQMTHELGCSMDYLINESMRLYARSRDFPAEGQQPGQGGGFNAGPGGFGQPTGPGVQGGQGAPVDRFNVGYQQGPAPEHRTFDRIQPVGQGARPAPQSNPFGGSPAPPAPPAGLATSPPPPPPRPTQQSAGWGQPHSTGGFGAVPAPQAPPSTPQSNPFGGPPAPPGGMSFGASTAQQTSNFGNPPTAPQQSFGAPVAPGGGRPTLYLIFNNNRYLVDKDKFVIGRGTQQTDLTIRDGNISRKHCAVIFHNNAFYIKDLGSTNGIEFKNNRIESKKIDEGDVFYLCDYELRFSYH